VHIVLLLSVAVVIAALGGVGAHLASQRHFELQAAESAMGSLAKQQAQFIRDRMESVEVVMSQLESQVNILHALGAGHAVSEHDLLRRYMDLLPGAIDILLYEVDGRVLTATASQPGSTLLVNYCQSLMLQQREAAREGYFAFRDGTASRCPPAGTLVHVRPLSAGGRMLWLLISPEAFQTILIGELPALATMARFRILSSEQSILAESAASSDMVPSARFPLEFSSAPATDGVRRIRWHDFATGSLLAAVSAPIKETGKSVQILYLPEEFLTRNWWPEVRTWLWLSGLFTLAWIVLSVFLVKLLTAYQRKLAASEQRFENSLDYAGIGAWDWNIETGDLYWSKRIAPIFGYRVGEYATSYENFLKAVHPEDRPLVESAVATCLEKGTPYRIEHRVVWSDGTVRWVEERGNVLRSATGENLRMLGVVIDITTTRDMRYELAVYQDQLEYQVRQRSGELAVAHDAMEAARQARTQMFANIGHELRIPLNALRRSVQQAMKLVDSPVATEYLQQADVGSQKMLSMINDTLDLSVLDVAQVSLDQVRFQLDHLHGDLIRTFRESATRKGLGFFCALAPDLAMLPLLGDYVRLRQVLNNLVDNAIEHTAYGKVDVSMDVQAATDSDLVLSCRVTDTGDGIAPAALAQLTALLGGTSDQPLAPHSTCLGLAICKRLVHIMGGQIGCDSVENRGSAFWFNVRLKKSAE
jgi:PAS domain S-box-containing protein